MKTSKTLSAFILLTFLFIFAGMSMLEEKTPKYRHVVLFKFKETATKEQIDEIVADFRKLPSKIDTIIDYEDGTDISPEKLADGFTHCFIVTFKDKTGLEKYLPHPAHQEFVKKLKPVLEKPLVVDFEVK